MLSLNARADGEAAPPPAADAASAAKQPLLLRRDLHCCSGADALLWAPLLLDPASADPTRQPARGTLTAPAHPALRASGPAHPQQPPSAALDIVPASNAKAAAAAAAARGRAGGAAGGGGIGAHRPQPASAPITIGGRRHDWWAAQLQEQCCEMRAGHGFVQCCRMHIGKVRQCLLRFVLRFRTLLDQGCTTWQQDAGRLLGIPEGAVVRGR